MELLLFSLNAIVIYLLADWIIKAIEKKNGKVLKHRQVVFFAVFLTLALTSFNVLKTLFV